MFMKKFSFIVLLLSFLSLGSFSFAQDASSLTGTVTDASGAVVQNADVLLIDTKTNTPYTAKTSSAGSYTFTALRPGSDYKITFSASNFQTYVVSDINIGVGRTVTQNAKLIPGTSQAVEVSADNKNQTINTVDASVGNNIDVKVLNSLPVQNRDSVTVLFSLQPGVTNGAVTGARTDQSDTTVDGLDVNDVAAGQAGTGFQVVSKAPVDSVQEFRGTVAGQLASNGPGSGGQFQLVTKSGTNAFHGLLYEYHRDAQLQANTWFNNNAATPIRKAPLIQNQFGGNLGGPILKDKLFFFFDFAESRILASTPTLVTVPLDSYRNGTINYVNNSAGCTNAARLNTTPNCITSLTPTQIAASDPQHQGINAAFLAYLNSRYPHANDLTAGNGYNTGGFRFNGPTPDNQTTYVLKLDYNLSNKMKLFARSTINRRDATQVQVRFPTDPVSNPFVDRSYSYVGGWIWQIGSNKVNTLSYGSTISKFNFPSTYDPTGTTSFTFVGLTNPFNTLSTQTRRIPIPELRDDFSYTKGAHQITFGGTFKAIKTHSLLLNDFNFPTIGPGGNTTGLNSALRPSDILNTSATTSGYDTAYITGLGVVSNISSNYNYDNKGAVLAQGTGAVRRYRYFQTEVYVGDSWKVSRALTLTYGLRYQYYSVPFEAAGAQSEQSIGFDDYFKARLSQSAANKSGTGSLPFITYGLGGKTNNGPGVYAPNYKDFAPRFSFAYNPTSFRKIVINGGVGVVFDRTVINAVNFIQDQSSYLFQQNNVAKPYGTVGDPATSLQNDPRIGANFSSNYNVGTGTAPAAPTIVNPFTPNVSATGVPNGLAIGRGQNAVDPNLKDPYSIAFNAGIQQDLGAGFIMRLNYVGRLGRRLLAQTDASQLIDTADPASGQTLSAAFTNLTLAARSGVPTGTTAKPVTVTPQPILESVVPGTTQNFYNTYAASYLTLGDFADFVKALSAGGRINQNVGIASQFAYNSYLTNKGSSAYNGLLFTLSKNLSKGLQFDFNYTWSHSIDNTSLNANAIAANNGLGFICNVLRPRDCRGNSDFDIQTVINADFVYDLPVGHGRSLFASTPGWLDTVIGGWTVSGIPQYRSGLIVNTTTGAFVAGYASNAPALFNGNRGAVAAHVAKQANGSVSLFTNGPATGSSNFSDPLGFTIGSRNNLRGPSLVSFDASLAKTFKVIPERLNAQFRGDGFNVLNHPVFSTPSTTDVNSGTFGNITAVAVAARVLQVSLRLEF